MIGSAGMSSQGRREICEEPAPAQAAAKVLAFLARDDFGRCVIADVRQT